MSLRRRDFLALAAASAAAACARTIPAGGTTPAGAGAGRELGAGGGPARAATPKRILVLGGTGFLGPHLVRAARARGHTLTLFNRGKSAPGLFPDVETILGDRLTDTDRLRGRDWDAVVDTWVMLPKSVRTITTLLRDHVRHYLFVSTISVYRLGRDPIDEHSPTLPEPAQLLRFNSTGTSAHLISLGAVDFGIVVDSSPIAGSMRGGSDRKRMSPDQADMQRTHGSAKMAAWQERPRPSGKPTVLAIAGV